MSDLQIYLSLSVFAAVILAIAFDLIDMAVAAAQSGVAVSGLALGGAKPRIMGAVSLRRDVWVS